MSAKQAADPWLVFSGPSLLSWRRDPTNWPDDGKLWKKATEDQVCFVGDTLPRAYCSTSEEFRLARDGDGIMVIGSHRSKSCDLPVYGLDIPHLGMRAVMSNNFYGWVVSVETPSPVDMSMFANRMSTEPCNPIYCSGFDARWVMGPPGLDQCVFTATMGSSHDIYAMFLIIAHQLRTKK